MTSQQHIGPFATRMDASDAKTALFDELPDTPIGALTPYQRRRVMCDAAERFITKQLTAAGVELAGYDQAIVKWLAAEESGEIIVTITGWVTRASLATVPAERTGVSWALYRTEPGADALVPAGIGGDQDDDTEPVEFARRKLIEYTRDHPGWVVKVYGPDDRLLAWAEWIDGAAVGYAQNGAKR